MRDNSKIFAAGMAINMPAIADPMKSEAYERERKPVEEEKAEEKKEENVQASNTDAAMCNERATEINNSRGDWDKRN